MKLARHHRSLLAWTLYACVLFNAFACSLGHAQSAGLHLSGLDSLFCSVSGNSVSLLAVGTCTLTASQAGNSSFAAAAPVSQSFAVAAAPFVVTPTPSSNSGGGGGGAFSAGWLGLLALAAWALRAGPQRPR